MMRVLVAGSHDQWYSGCLAIIRKTARLEVGVAAISPVWRTGSGDEQFFRIYDN